MHDASKIIISIALEGIALTIISRANIASIIRCVLRNPPAGDVLPIHLQVWPVAVVRPNSIWSLLLVVHSNEMTNFVNHAAHISHAVAPAQIHSAISAIAHARHIATARVEIANLCMIIIRLSLLHKQDARLGHHALDCLTECVLPCLVQTS